MSIRLDHIYKSFGDKVVLKDFCADLAAPGATAIMGPSGSGKTTLLHLLLGLLQPDSGSISGLEGLRHAMVFQEDRLLPWYSALQNVRLVLSDIPKDADKKAAESNRQKAVDILEAMGLGDALDTPIPELSGGMQRRVAIARALAYEPDLLVLDEAFRGLDDTLKLSVMSLVREVTKKETLVLVTHDQMIADFFAAKIIRLGS